MSSLSKALYGPIRPISHPLLPTFFRPRLAAFAEIVRTADQFCPKTLHAAMGAAAADMVIFPATGRRIQKKTPVQLIFLRHSRRSITSLPFAGLSAGIQLSKCPMPENNFSLLRKNFFCRGGIKNAPYQSKPEVEMIHLYSSD